MDRHVERGLDRGREPGPARPGEKGADGGSSSSVRAPMGESARSSAAASVQKGAPVTTVLICDDRRSVREGLTRVMSAVPGVHRIDCVAHGDELLTRFSRQTVDVVLVGTQRAVPTGVEATRRLVAAHPQANVIVFGAPDDSGSIAAAIAGGARGYLRWDASRPELVAALAHTLASTSVPAPRTPADSGVQLTERELQVLRGMAQGKSNGQIGRELYLSEDTVKTHARRLFRKLGVRDRAQAVAHGFRRGLVS
jgi:DNA-binding NarL/FixJ family response regulator